MGKYDNKSQYKFSFKWVKNIRKSILKWKSKCWKELFFKQKYYLVENV